MEQVVAYTDGACSGNPGPGGYACVLTYRTKELEISEGFRRTTNNRMELWAVIAALEALKRPVAITVVTDSAYVANAIQKGWLQTWLRKGFKDKANADLWRRYLNAAKPHQVTFQWIKGHAGHPYNERCDKLAVEASKSPNLKIDAGYEASATTAANIL